METLMKLMRKPIAIAALGFLAGLIIGLPLLGWWLWPVEWINAAPAQLQNDYQRDYLCMVIDSYIRNQYKELMQLRWEGLGESAPDLLKLLTPTVCRFTSEAEINNFRTVQGIAALSSTTKTDQESEPEDTDKLSFPWPLLYFCGGTLVIGGGVAFFFIRNKKPLNIRRKTKPTLADTSKENQEEKMEEKSFEEPPLTQFMTTYRIGDDLYDDSFSIDSPNGEFLGECGVGIADTIGVGEPKKVTALEIWLFDKNDIQTVTKVLMSEHAFNDSSIRQQLAAKGETLQIEPGQEFKMETATLQLRARVIDMVYGRGPLPESSFFSRMTLEISVWNKA